MNIQKDNDKMVNVVLKIKAKMAYWVHDEFHQECIEENDDGSFTIRAVFPEGEWIYGYVLSNKQWMRWKGLIIWSLFRRKQ